MKSQLDREYEAKYESHTIHHEHLAGISQHDWYIGCFQTNSAIRLEDVTYRVICLETGGTDTISFTSLHELVNWAGY